MAVDGSRAGHEPSVVDLNRWPNDETAVMRSDLQDLVRGAVAYGLDAFLEASRRQNYQNTTNLIGYVPPTMPGSPWNRNAGTGRGFEHRISDLNPISTSEHHEMLLFIAVKVHWRATTGSRNGFNNRICAICFCAGKPHSNTFPSSPFIPGTLVGCISEAGKQR